MFMSRLEKFLDSLSPIERYIMLAYYFVRDVILYPYAFYRHKRLPFRELSARERLVISRFHGDSVYGALVEDKERAVLELMAKRIAERENATTPKPDQN